MSQATPFVIDYDYRSVPTIRKFTLDNSRIRGIMGPFGSGKSSGCLMDIIRRSHEQNRNVRDGVRRSKWAVVRNTTKELQDTTIKTVKQWLPEGLAGVWKETNLTYYIDCFDGVELEMAFRALDREDQVRDLLSLELTGAWLNEYREIHKAIFEGIDGRIGRYPSVKEGGCKYHGIIMDTNPPDEGSYWYKYYEKERPKNAKLFKQPSGLSPQAENLPNLIGGRGYYTNLMQGKGDQYINVYIHGKYGFLISGKVVYENFNDNFHVAANRIYPIPGLPILLGFDFALNPSMVIAQLTTRGQLLVLDELMGPGMGLKQFMKSIALPFLIQKYKGYAIRGAGDPSGNSKAPTDETSCYDVLWSDEIGLKTIEPAATNALLPRIMAVDDFLSRLVDGMPAFVLSPNCEILRKGFNGGYHRKRIPGLDEQYYDEPDKNMYSHLQDGLQYLCMGCLGSAEKDIRRQQVADQVRAQMLSHHDGAFGRAMTPRVADSLVGY